jgi:tetratricopeptide (TPR) repeat protein
MLSAHNRLPFAAVTVLLALAASVKGQDDLAAKSQTARQAMIAGDFPKAERLYGELVRALPDNPGLWVNLGLAQHSAGKYREGIASFASALKLDPKLTHARFLTGVAYLKLGEPARAVAPLRQAHQANPADPMVLLELADALLTTEAFDEASASFGKLVDLKPGDPRAWQGLGLSYLGLARKSFAALDKAAPDSAFVVALQANSRSQEGNWRAAFTLYRRAAEMQPNLRGVHAGIAEVYRSSGHPDWAAVEEQRERALPASDCKAHPGECAFLEKRYEQAIVPAKTAPALYWNTRAYTEIALAAIARLSNLPTSPQLHELIAEAHTVRDQHRAAANELRLALKLDSGNARLEALLAKSLWRGRDFDAALPLLRKLVAAAPGSAEINFQLGDVLLQQGDPEAALPWLRKAAQLKPDLLPARASLGRACVQTDKPGDAIPHLKAALPLDQDGSLHFQLSRAYEHSGNSVLAKQALQQYQTIAEARSKKQRVEEELAITAP